MGYDATTTVGAYGRFCLPGAERMFAYLQDAYDAGSLGCWNPASVFPSNGQPSLHAEGRAMDVALNANDPVQKKRGDRLFADLVADYDAYGLQEILWDDKKWSYKRRAEGVRPSDQEAAHESHVHVGLDVDAALNWTTDRIDMEADLSFKAAVDIAKIVQNETNKLAVKIAALEAKIAAIPGGGGSLPADWVKQVEDAAFRGAQRAEKE